MEKVLPFRMQDHCLWLLIYEHSNNWVHRVIHHKPSVLHISERNICSQAYAWALFCVYVCVFVYLWASPSFHPLCCRFLCQSYCGFVIFRLFRLCVFLDISPVWSSIYPSIHLNCCPLTNFCIHAQLKSPGSAAVHWLCTISDNTHRYKNGFQRCSCQETVSRAF